MAEQSVVNEGGEWNRVFIAAHVFARMHHHPSQGGHGPQVGGRRKVVFAGIKRSAYPLLWGWTNSAICNSRVGIRVADLLSGVCDKCVME